MRRSNPGGPRYSRAARGFGEKLRGIPAIAIVFLASAFIYVWLRVCPSLDYYTSAPVFYLTGAFFKSFLAEPGGLVLYGAAFLAQLSFYDWLGALVFVAAAVLLFLVTRCALKQLSGMDSTGFGLLPLFVLLLLRNRYDEPALVIGLGLLLTNGFAAGWMLLRSGPGWLQLASCWVGAAVLFYAGGVWPCVVFLILCCWFEADRKGKWVVGFGCLAPVVAVLWWMLFCSCEPVARLLKPVGTGLPGICGAIAYLVLPVAAMLLRVRGRLGVARANAPVDVQKEPARESSPSGWLSSIGRNQVYAVFLLGWMVVWLGMDGRQRALQRISACASRKEYKEVITQAAKLSSLDQVGEMQLRLALYHEGRLAQDLFCFTNQLSGTLLPGLLEGLSGRGESFFAQSQTLFELGQVNEAEHYGHEALELKGPSPEVLWLLARIHVIKGYPEAATVYLRALSQIPFQRQRAQGLLRKLKDDPSLTNDVELAQVRARMLTVDTVHRRISFETLLEQSLQSNPRNQMAFEYLMAKHLFSLELDKLVANIGRLENFAYSGIPRSYEEAILLYQQLKGVKVDLRGRSIRPETWSRFQRFVAAANSGAGRTEAGRRALARAFGDTYWFYYGSRTAAGAARPQPADL